MSYLDSSGVSAMWTKIKEHVSAKQDKLTFDTAPTSGSSNPVTSGGIYTMKNSLDTAIGKKQDKLTFDNMHQIGDVIITPRKNIGPKWAICNGDVIPYNSDNNSLYQIMKKSHTDFIDYTDSIKEKTGLSSLSNTEFRYLNGYYLVAVNDSSNSKSSLLVSKNPQKGWTYFEKIFSYAVSDFAYGNGTYVAVARESSHCLTYQTTDPYGAWKSSDSEPYYGNYIYFVPSNIMFDGKNFVVFNSPDWLYTSNPQTGVWTKISGTQEAGNSWSEYIDGYYFVYDSRYYSTYIYYAKGMTSLTKYSSSIHGAGYDYSPIRHINNLWITAADASGKLYYSTSVETLMSQSVTPTISGYSVIDPLYPISIDGELYLLGTKVQKSGDSSYSSILLKYTGDKNTTSLSSSAWIIIPMINISNASTIGSPVYIKSFDEGVVVWVPSTSLVSTELACLPELSPDNAYAYIKTEE